MRTPLLASFVTKGGGGVAPSAPVITFGSFVTATSGSPRSIAVPYPAGIEAGDYLLLIAGRSAAGSWNAPSGFTSVVTGHRGVWWRKHATGSESGTVTVTNSGNIKGIMLLIKGLAAAPTGAVASQASVSSGNIPYPSITPSAPALIVASGHGLDGGVAGLLPSGTNPTFELVAEQGSAVRMKISAGLSDSTSALGARSVAATGFANFYHGIVGALLL